LEGTKATTPPTGNLPYHRQGSGGERSEDLIPIAKSAAVSWPARDTITPREEDRMAKVLVLYKTPKSAEAFDKHYASVHIPLAKKIPGLKKYDISKGPVGTPAGPSGIHLIATLHFDSLDALKAGMGSAEGRAAGGDLANFADGGTDLLIFDEKEA
jgi:uncharacterized protein (TIGR02118 family)